MRVCIASIVVLLDFTALYEALVSFRYLPLRYQLALIPLVTGLIIEAVIIFILFIWRYLVRTPSVAFIGVATYLMGFLLSSYLGYEFTLVTIIAATLLISPTFTLLSERTLNVVEVTSLSATLAALVAFILLLLIPYIPFLSKYVINYLKLLPWHDIIRCALGLLMIIYGISLVRGGKG